MRDAMIILENVKKTVPGLDILKGISLRFDKGLCFIVGDSGAGKSTLMNMISTMDVPTEGVVRYELGDTRFEYTAATKDEEVSKFRAKHLGIIFQDFNLVGDMDGEQNLCLGGALAGIPRQPDIIRKCLSDVNLSEQEHKLMNVMSGGERQRVAIARALYKDADFILADEPTGNLDEKNTRDIFARLKEISREKIVIVISHNREMAEQYGDRIIRMQDGCIVEDRINGAASPVKKTGEKSKDPAKDPTREKESQEAAFKPGIPRDLMQAFALNNIKKFRAKFISMVLVMGLVLGGAAILFSMNHLMSNQVDAMNYVYFDADEVDITKTMTHGATVRAIAVGALLEPITPQEEAELKAVMGFAETVPVDWLGYGIIRKDASQKISLKAIRLNEFFQKRIMSDQIEGSFPQDENQMIIGEDLSHKFFAGGGIGEAVEIGDALGNRYSFTICGINHAKNVDGIYYCYASCDTLLKGHVPPDNFGSIFPAKTITDTENMDRDACVGGTMTGDYEAKEIIAGRLPEKAGELAVNMDALISLYQLLTGEYRYHTLSEVQSGKPEAMEMLNTVLGEDYYIGLNDAYEGKIVGLHSRNDLFFFVEESWLEEATLKRANTIECYFGDMNRTRKADFSLIKEQYDYKSYYLERFDTAVNNQMLWKLMFLFGALLSLVTVFALANSYARVTLSERMYEIGIIKSLGGGKREIGRLLRADQLCLGGASGLLASGLYLLALLILRLTRQGVMSSGLLTLAVALSLPVFGLLCCVLFSRGKISRILKTKPIEDFKKRM